MTSIIQSTGFDYATLDPEARIVVRQKTDELKGLLRAAAQNIFDIGGKLAEVRDQLQHNRAGGFEAWLAAEFGMSRRTAYNFIGVYERFNRANFAQLDIAASALYLLAAPSTPDTAREEALRRAEAGERITHQKAKKIVQAELNAKFERNAIVILGRTDDGAEHRAIEVARRLVAAGIWNGTDRIEFDAYALHDRLFGPEALDPQQLVFGRDIFHTDPAVRLKSRILDLLKKPLTISQIRTQLNIDLNDKARMETLRRALELLVNEHRVKRVRDLYLPAEAGAEVGDDADIRAILDTLGDSPKTVQEIEGATRLGLPRVRELLPKLIDTGKVIISEDNRAALAPADDEAIAALRAALAKHREKFPLHQSAKIAWLQQHTGLGDEAINAAIDALVATGELERFDLAPTVSVWLPKLEPATAEHNVDDTNPIWLKPAEYEQRILNELAVEPLTITALRSRVGDTPVGSVLVGTLLRLKQEGRIREEFNLYSLVREHEADQHEDETWDDCSGDYDDEPTLDGDPDDNSAWERDLPPTQTQIDADRLLKLIPETEAISFESLQEQSGLPKDRVIRAVNLLAGALKVKSAQREVIRIAPTDPLAAIPADQHVPLLHLLHELRANSESLLSAAWDGADYTDTSDAAKLAIREGWITPVNKWSSGSQWCSGYVLSGAGRDVYATLLSAHSDEVDDTLPPAIQRLYQRTVVELDRLINSASRATRASQGSMYLAGKLCGEDAEALAQRIDKAQVRLRGALNSLTGLLIVLQPEDDEGN